MEQREIKFKVWDNVDHFHGPFDLQDLQSPRRAEWTSDCPVMQYTGLKDKNGREIYEGDILSLLAHGSRNDLAEVRWSECGWWAAFQNDATRRLYPACIQSEVVGNIYEHPNLLFGGI